MIDRELRLEDQDLRLLKIILTDQLKASEFANTYDESLFTGDCKNFAKQVINYIKTYKSLPTKRVLLDNVASQEIREEYDEVWNQVLETEASAAEFKYDLDKIKNRFCQERLGNLQSVIEESSDLKWALQNARKELDRIQQVQTGTRQAYTQKTLKSYMPDFKQNYNAKRLDKTLGRGILTGYSFLDYVKNGMSPSELLIICADTGMGKSMLLSNLAIQMWMQKNTVITDCNNYTKGYNVLYFSLEMPYEACARRALSRLADVPMYGLRDSALSPYQMESLIKATNFIDKYPYEFEVVDIPRGVTVAQIEARFQEAVTRYEPHIVVVDYLGLLEDHDSQGDDWLKLGYIAAKLHEFARAYNIVVMTAAQLNRPTTRTPKDPGELIGIHRIGRSSLIMHNADIGIQIECRKDEQNYSDLRYHIIKNREGELGNHALIKNFANASLLDMDPPFIPKQTLDGYGPNTDSITNMDDITELLKKYKWGKN